MCIYGGYKTQTVTQVGNIIGAYDSGELSLGGVRVYIAALVSVASREAAKRSNSKFRKRGLVTPRFLIQELTRLTALPNRRVNREIKLLKKLGVLRFEETDISFDETEHEFCSKGLLDLSRGRSSKRPIPLPRPLLRFLAKSNKASLIKTALAYVTRGLSISRSGEITGKGSVKATTIAQAMNLSERSVRSARSELLRLGFLSDDEGSTQIKLNRTGAYFVVNLSWKEAKMVVDNSVSPVAEIAPLPLKNAVVFAPPYKNKKTLFRSKNQETQSCAPNPSGLCAAKTENKIPKAKPQRLHTNIRDVQIEDLKSFGRVEELFRQAVKIGLIEGTEANAINFIGAAARATRVEGDAPRVFMGIIRGKLWENISEADEDRALEALRRYRADDPDRFRFAA